TVLCLFLLSTPACASPLAVFALAIIYPLSLPDALPIFAVSLHHIAVTRHGVVVRFARYRVVRTGHRVVVRLNHVVARTRDLVALGISQRVVATGHGVGVAVSLHHIAVARHGVVRRLVNRILAAAHLVLVRLAQYVAFTGYR